MPILSKTARTVAGALVVSAALAILGVAIYSALVHQDYARIYGWGDLTLGFLLAKVFALVDMDKGQA